MDIETPQPAFPRPNDHSHDSDLQEPGSRPNRHTCIKRAQCQQKSSQMSSYWLVVAFREMLLTGPRSLVQVGLVPSSWTRFVRAWVA